MAHHRVESGRTILCLGDGGNEPPELIEDWPRFPVGEEFCEPGDEQLLITASGEVECVELKEHLGLGRVGVFELAVAVDSSRCCSGKKELDRFEDVRLA